MVQLRGLIKSGTIATSAFTLPVGYRPPATLILSGITNLAASHATGAASAGTAHTHAITSLGNVAMRVDISTAGAVSIVSNASNGYYSLSGLEFSVS
jgi:hypothetical protein